MGRESVCVSTILFITDADFKGSGYMKVSIPLCDGLAKLGHKIFMAGLNYEGQEHNFPFTIIPTRTFEEVHAMIINLHKMEHIDVVIVALDLPHQSFLIEKVKPLGMKYICITPLENPPLTMSWAAPLLSADGVYFISEMGALAARKAGITYVKHIQIGVDPLWVMPTKDDRERIRKSMGLDGKFVVLTVADNQERKNLWAGLEMIARAKRDGATNLKHILITREHLTFGWRLRDLATELEINDELIIIERGLPFTALWTYYVAADVYLLCSKGEGLGLPILESMACGLPVMATDTGAIPELLEDGRGYKVPVEYTFRDVWGNGKRDMVDVEAGAKILRELMETDMSDTALRAKEYVNQRTWDIPVNQIHEKLVELTDDKG
jgi:glycosyltransferase involved in cell wall biosynthesis